MAELPPHPPKLEYAAARRPRWSLRYSHSLELAVDTAFVLIASILIVVSVAVGRILVLLVFSPDQLFGIRW